MRLFFAVLETHTLVIYSIMLLLWGILAPVKGPVAGGSLAFLVVVVVLSTTVNKTKATALGLSRKNSDALQPRARHVLRRARRCSFGGAPVVVADHCGYRRVEHPCSGYPSSDPAVSCVIRCGGA